MSLSRMTLALAGAEAIGKELHDFMRAGYLKRKRENDRKAPHKIKLLPQAKEVIDEINYAITAGMIPRIERVDGALYAGYSRTGTVGEWRVSGSTGAFFVKRVKFGLEFVEEVPAAEDGGEYDVFVPMMRVL